MEVLASGLSSLLTVGLVALVGLVMHRVHHARETAWRSAAVRLGLQYHSGGLMLHPRVIMGLLDGLMVTVEVYKIGSRKYRETWTRVVVDVSRQVPKHTEIRPETVWSRNDILTAPDVRTGDPEFDSAVAVYGKPVWLRAVLDARTRHALHQLIVHDEGRLSEGMLTWRQRGVVSDAGLIVQTVESLVYVGGRLSLDRRTLPSALRRNATEDPHPGVRYEALATLLGAFPGSRESIDAARRACGDVSPEVRILGASSMGSENHAALEDLLFGDHGLQSATLAQAFARAATVATPEQREALVVRALRTQHGELWAPAADAAGQYDVAAAVAPLRAALDATAPRDTARITALVRAVGALGDHASESRLLALIDCDEEHTEVAAIEALGRVGGLSAVEPLLSKTRGMFTAADIKNAARAAIASIQARHGGGEAGALTVVDESGVGAVSVVEQDV